MKKSVSAVMLFFVLLCGISLVGMHSAKATTSTFYSSASNGYIYSYLISYSASQSSSSGTVDNGYTQMMCGQWQIVAGGTYYYVDRSFVFFDTSSIPVGAVITSATLNLDINALGSGGSPTVVIQNGQPTYPHDPLAAGDFYSGNYNGNGGSATVSSTGWNSISLSSQGLSWINVGGETKFCLRTPNDINGVFNNGVDAAIDTSQSGNTPYLSVTYQFPITASSDSHSTISPSGTTYYDQGSSPTFTYSANTGYSINSVLVDGGSVPITGSYSFSNVQGPHTISASTSPITYTITVYSSYGSPTASGSANYGGSYATSVTSPWSGGSGVQYVCTGYSIDNGGAGAQYSGTSYTFTDVTAAHTIYYYWQKQVSLTVSSSYGSTSGSGWYNVGSVAYAGLSTGTVSAGSGAQYAFTGWSTGGTNYAQSNAITMNTPVTASANWVTQYYLTVNSAYGVPSGSGWYTQGTTAYAGLNAGTVNGGSGIQYVFSSWSTGGTSYAQSSAITMNQAQTSTASWTTQYQVSFAQSGLDSSAQGTVVTAAGNNEAYSALPYQVWVNSGSQVIFSWTSPVSSSPGKQFVLSGSSQTSPYTVSAAATITGNYGTQYYLTVTSSYGSPSGQGWYNSGAYATFTVSTPAAGATGTQYVFSAWTGTGTGSYSGSTASDSVTMNMAITESAAWTTQYQVTFAQSGLDSSASGTVVTVNSVAKAYSALPFSLWVNSGGTATFSYASTVSSSNSGESFSLQTASATSPLTVNAAETVTGTYTASYSQSSGNLVLTLQAKDTAGNLLPNTVFTLNGTTYPALSGQISLTNITSGTSYQGSATWKGVSVNATFSVTVTSSMTCPVSCTAYPYTFNSVTHHVAANRGISNVAWDGTDLAVNFSASTSTCTFVTDCGQVPTYVTGVSYVLSTAYTGGVFSVSVANSSNYVSVNFDAWGSGFYVEEADTPLSTLSWNGETLTVNFVSTGSGTLVFSCGSYGVPVTVTEMSGAYNTATGVLTGLYSNVASVVVSWASSSSGGSGGSGGSSGGSTSVTLSSQNLGTVTAGTNQTETLAFSFVGSNFNVESVSFTGSLTQYVTAINLPSTFYGSSGQVTVEFNLPAGTAAGSYSLTATLTGLDANGVQHQSTAPISFSVASEESGYGGFSVPTGWVPFAVVVAILSVVIVGSLAVLTKRRA